MPFPNFHSCRIRQPGEFEPESFRQIIRGGVHLVIGKLKDKSATTTQAIRYPKQTWTVAKAKADCEEKGGILFEPASTKVEAEMEEVPTANIKLTQREWEAFESGGEVEWDESRFEEAWAAAATDDHAKHLRTEDIAGVPIFAAGPWTNSRGEKRTWTVKDLDEMVENHKRIGEKVKPFLKLMHLGDKDHKRITSMPALGWLDNLRREGTKLIADVKKVPKKVADLIRAGSYRRISVEIFHTFKDEATGKVFKNVVGAAGLLGAAHPSVTTLGDVMKLFELPGLELEEFEEREDVVTFYEEQHQGGEQMDEEKVKELIDSALANQKKGHEEALTNQRQEFAKALGLDGDADPLKAAEDLKKSNEAKEKELAEREAKEFTAQVDGLILQGKKDCKILPAQEPSIRQMVSGWNSAVDENGKLEFTLGKETKTGSVLEALNAYFKGLPPIPGHKFAEEAQQADPSESEKKKVADKVPEDVKRFAEEHGYEVDPESVEKDQEIQQLIEKSNFQMSYERAMNIVDGVDPQHRTPEPTQVDPRIVEKGGE